MASRYQRHLRAIEGEPLPCAYVDLDAFDANARLVVEKVRAADKTLRPATKSVRVPELLKRVAEIGGETVRGLMTYTARETAWLAEQGFTDLLLGYPTLQENDAVALARAAKRTLVRVVCDAREQVEAIGAAAIAEGSVV
ncbi:MAG: alanine racemase, partial [Polyangiales bacterium]